MSNETAANIAAPAAEPSIQASTSTSTEGEQLQSGITSNSVNGEVEETNESTTPVQPEGMDSQSDGQNTSEDEPKNLEEALKMFNAMESKRTEETVQETEDSGKQSGQDEQHKEPEQRDTSDNNVVNTQSGTDNNQEAGESTNRSEGFNARSYVQNIENQVVQQAQQEAAKELSDAGVKMLGLSDITQRDEESGKIALINPDNGQEFADRVAAQTWLDTQNNQVRAEAQKLANDKAAVYRRSLGPAIRTQVFKETTYKQMDPATQNVFNELIEPYAVNNKAGQRVGFDCDLEAIAKQAQAIVQSLTPVQQGQSNESAQVNIKQETKPSIATPGNSDAPVTTPPVDTPTGSGTGEPEYPEPKTLEDALKIVNAQDAKKQGGQNGK